MDTGGVGNTRRVLQICAGVPEYPSANISRRIPWPKLGRHTSRLWGLHYQAKRAPDVPQRKKDAMLPGYFGLPAARHGVAGGLYGSRGGICVRERTGAAAQRSVPTSSVATLRFSPCPRSRQATA